MSKYVVVSNKTLAVVGQGDDSEYLANEFDMRNHVILKSDTYTKPITNQIVVEHPTVKTIATTIWWDFSAMSAKDKKALVSNSKVGNFIKCKDLINKYKISIVCCSGQMDQIKEQIKQAQNDGILPV